MADWIDRQALFAEINAQREIARTSYPRLHFVVSDVLQCIYNAPAVDAVEVVRCKDCKLRCPESIAVARHCTLSGIMVDDDDFCSYGEWREENE